MLRPEGTTVSLPHYLTVSLSHCLTVSLSHCLTVLALSRKMAFAIRVSKGHIPGILLSICSISLLETHIARMIMRMTRKMKAIACLFFLMTSI